MRFIGILLLFICCRSHTAVAKELSQGNTNEFHVAISKFAKADAEEPMIFRRSMVITAHSIIKKKLGSASLLPNTVSILCHVKHMSATVMTVDGTHSKNYLRHIYPAMHYW